MIMSSRNRQIFNLWSEIQDIVGPANLWPVRVRRNFWNKEPGHFDRICLCAFAYVNGLNPLVFYEWFDLLGIAYQSESFRHFRCLFRLFENGNYSRSLYSWNVSNNRYEYLDGTARVYVPRSNR